MMLKKPIESISVHKAVKYDKLRYCQSTPVSGESPNESAKHSPKYFFPMCPLNECVKVMPKTQMQRNMGLA